MQLTTQEPVLRFGIKSVREQEPKGKVRETDKARQSKARQGKERHGKEAKTKQAT